MKNSSSHAFGVGPTRELNLRVSVAVLARVLFKHPRNGKWMLAMERKSTLMMKGEEKFIEVKAQPFGGAVRISDLQLFQKNVGEFHFDSSRSRDENDFRIFIRPSHWPLLKDFCIQHLKDRHDPVLENDVTRELVEEFKDALQIKLTQDQFFSKPAGIVVEESPVPTKNTRVRGYPTVRVYHIFETILTDPALSKAVILASNRISDQDLSECVRNDALSGGRGRANGILAMPYRKMVDYYTTLPIPDRDKRALIDGHPMAETMPAVLEGIEVPKYKRI